MDALEIEHDPPLSKRQTRRQKSKAKNKKTNTTDIVEVSCSDLPRATDEPGGELPDQDGIEASSRAKHRCSLEREAVYAAAEAMNEHVIQTMHLAVLMFTIMTVTNGIGLGTAAYIHGMRDIREKASKEH